MLNIIIISLIALQILDFASTLYILRNGGLELNGTVRFLMDRLGKVPGLLAAKLIAGALTIIAALEVPALGWALVAAYAGVVFWNAREARRLLIAKG